MSELQIALMVLGALVVGGVFAYNRFQETRFRKRADNSFEGEPADALMEPALRRRAERLEPHLETQQREASETDRAPSGRVEPAGLLDIAAENTMDEDSPIDYTVQVTCGQNLPRPALRQLLDALDGIGRRPHVMASLADGLWIPLANAPAGITKLRVVLQLADRRGHVTEDDLTALRSLVTQWAHGVNAEVRAPDVAQHFQAAKDLDRLCAEVDVVVGLNVVAPSGEPFSGTKLRSCAETAGSRLENGVFRFVDARGAAQYSLENQQGERFDSERLGTATIGGITLLLDVPRIEQGVKVFDQMVDAGRQLASCLGGTLVDDNRVAVTEQGLEQIRSQLRQIYKAMEARGIRAGSRVALRLFA